MMALLVFKERFKTLYKKYELYLEPTIKFIYSFIVLYIINQSIGYDERLKSILIILALSLVLAFTPSQIFVLLTGLVSLVHVYALSKELSLIVLIVFGIVYYLFVRFTPKLGYLLVAIPILYILKVPFVIPIVAGLILSPISIAPVSCGVLIYYLFDLIKNNFTVITSSAPEELIQTYIYLVNAILFNKLMLLTIIVFACVILTTYFIGRMSIDHVWDIAIVAGATVNILVFLIGDLILNITTNLIGMLIGTIISAGIVYIIQFFRITVDYSRVEKVQFEDDEYYYYVKAVPKITVTTPEVNVKRINARKGINSRTDSIQKSVNKTIDDEDF